MNPYNIWTSPLFTDALALDIFVKASLILGGVWFTAWVLRHSSAAVRHSFWSLALMGLLLLPVLSAQLPSWHIALPEPLQQQWSTFMQETAPPVAIHQKPSRTPWQKPSPRVDVDVKAQTLDIPIAPAHQPTLRAARSTPLPWQAWLMWIWRAGVVVLLGRFLFDAFRIRSLGRRAEPLPSTRSTKFARVAQHRMGVRRKVRYLHSDAVSMAMTWGSFRPTVLLPTSALAWPDARIEVVLLHELAHVKRWDYAIHVLAQCARALYWMNPLVWFALRRLHAEQERACDDRVLQTGTGACDYALHLVNIARSYLRGPQAVRGGMALARRSALSERVEALVNPEAKRQTLTFASSLWTSTAGLMLVLPVAALQLGAWTTDLAATRVLIEQLENPDPMVWQQAGWQEALSVESATELIPRLLNHENGLVRAHTAWSLGEHAETRAVVSLIEALKDPNANVRLQALLALEKIGDERALVALGALIHDPCPDVRLTTVAVIKGLCHCEALKTLPTALADTDVRVRRSAVSALGEVIHSIQTRPSKEAAQTFETHLPQAITSLVYALKDQDMRVRAGAAYALGESGHEGAYAPLKSALWDYASEVRLESARALGKLGISCAEPVLRLALRDECPDVRAMAAWALDQIQTV